MRSMRAKEQVKGVKLFQGSALIAVFIASTMIFIVLGAFIPATMTEVKVQLKNNYYKVSNQLAEAGLEEAIWGAKNHSSLGDWTGAGWSVTGDSSLLYKSIDLQNELYNLDNPYNAKIEVVMRNPLSNPPGTNLNIVSRAKVINTNTNEVVVRKLLTSTTRVRSPFRGFLALKNLMVSRTPQFNSYKSSEDPNSYDPVLNSTNSAVIGSLSSAINSIVMNNATINGNVVSGAFSPVEDGALSVDEDSSVSGTVVSGFKVDLSTVFHPDTTGFLTSF